MQLAQAGSYVGLDAIEEYARFFDVDSMPHWEVGLTLDTTISLKDSDDDAQEGECTFLVVSSISFATNDISANQFVHGGSALFKIYLRPVGLTGIRIRRANVYFSEEYMTFIFGESLNGHKTSEWTCTTIESTCPETFALNRFTSVSDCVDQMQRIENVGANANLSGNSRGCKNLHATFVGFNPAAHCAHTSIVPQVDSNGQVKCQEPGAYVDPLTLFVKDDIEFFENRVVELGLGKDGYKVCNCENPEDYSPFIDGSFWRLFSVLGQINPLPPIWPLGEMPACAACAGINF
ncbi:expressed unknown protein [Seminavis robusta]|uniref:Uncharacterized protein n=1 Tax=Seminavis robusta TaxID=568900 RepID=A0A9N8H429_9STRA|nr:expressed unknown protein [Seminavis robusta]|eukprot:Sro103_g052370.1 n/a (292) ;mRNA; f:23851-24843